MAALSFPIKRTAESLTLAFDFNTTLGTAETLVSGTWSISAVRPNTASTAGMLLGSATVLSGQTFQRVTGGVDGALYSLAAQVTTSNSNALEENALLLVSNNPYV